MKKNKPLCVDLDGTLVITDTFWESYLLLIKKKPWYVFVCFYWLIRYGEAYLRQEVSKRALPTIALLPYLPEFILWLKKHYDQGRPIILVTAADKIIANEVAARFNLFRDIIASDGKINNKGVNKRTNLNTKFGAKNYDYAGNSHNDLKVWRGAHEAIVVNPKYALKNRVKKIARVQQIFYFKPRTLWTSICNFPIYGYLKDVVIALLAMNYIPQTNSRILLAFIFFLLLDTSLKLFSLLFCIEEDRANPSSRANYFASGQWYVGRGIFWAYFLLIGVLLLWPLVLPHTIFLALIYLGTQIMTNYYSVYPLISLCFLLLSCILQWSIYLLL